jgi:two-component system, chemotaxis family, protein-glutamate methylesterase/glutaminase
MLEEPSPPDPRLRVPKRDIIVIGASAGGIESLKVVLAGLPQDFPGALLIVLHMAPKGGNALASILDRAGPLHAATAVDGERIVAGRVYVCRADHHLLVGDGRVLVRRGPRENGYRPGVDPLFRSAALRYGSRVVAVVLSGTLSDGAAGLATVRSQGGSSIVQDPHDALYPGMPTSALQVAGADFIVPSHDIGPLLERLATGQADPPREPVATDAARSGAPSAQANASEEPERADALRREVALLEGERHLPPPAQLGVPSPWPCPDCSGVLWEVPDEDVLRFRCRVGHAWAAENLLTEQDEAIERAMWVALRALEDRLALARRVHQRTETKGFRISADRVLQDAEELERDIAVLRGVLQRTSPEQAHSSDEAAT